MRMQSSGRNHLILASVFALLFAAPACFADLMCYVCDDCADVTKDTPLLACNADFFNQGGSTEASTVTTTTMTTIVTTDTTAEDSTTSSPEETTSTRSMSTSPEVTTASSEEPSQSTEMTTDITSDSTETTTEQPAPTPNTVAPLPSTTALPTPPSLDDIVIRQRRSQIDTSVTYHCYSIHKTANNTQTTERGCVRVETQQSACGQIKLQHNDTIVKTCDPCSMNACNGATSLLKSSLWATLLLGVVAAVLQCK